MLPFSKGQFRARLAETKQDVIAAQRLRYVAFRAGRAENALDDGLDRDVLDDQCRHLVIETQMGGSVVATCRLMLIRDPGLLRQCYSSRFYDLGPLAQFHGPFLEIGRFCLDPAVRDPDILRLAWAALTRIVDAEAVTMMFGCSSFAGTDPAPHADALACLAQAHIGPLNLRPGRRAKETVPLEAVPHDPKRAMQQMPPLLRSYLAMGGWVTDHAVLDRDLDTFHVFTAVEIAAIPPTRARLLRADAR